MPSRPTPASVIPVRALAALALGLLPVTALAAAAPAETHLDFTVLKDGDPIGLHRIDLTRTADGETVSINTNILVRVAYVPVYRFEHAESEVWRNGRLVSLRSRTDDDGDKHTLQVTAAADHVEIDGDGAASRADPGIIPASLWNRDLVTRKVLINTLTGRQMAVSVADLGEDSIRSHGTTIRAHHYRVSGELKRDLWYSPSGTLVQVEFKAKDDSDIRYVLG